MSEHFMSFVLQMFLLKISDPDLRLSKNGLELSVNMGMHFKLPSFLKLKSKDAQRRLHELFLRKAE